MRSTLFAVLAILASAIGASASDPIGFIGHEFRMEGVACFNVRDTQRLGVILVAGHFSEYAGIRRTIEANEFACAIVDREAIYIGAVERSEFVAGNRMFVVDHYVPAEGAGDLYVWRGLPAGPSV